MQFVVLFLVIIQTLIIFFVTKKFIEIDSRLEMYEEALASHKTGFQFLDTVIAKVREELEHVGEIALRAKDIASKSEESEIRQ